MLQLNDACPSISKSDLQRDLLSLPDENKAIKDGDWHGLIFPPAKM